MSLMITHQQIHDRTIGYRLSAYRLFHDRTIGYQLSAYRLRVYRSTWVWCCAIPIPSN